MTPKLHKFKGEWRTSSEIARITGICASTIRYRLQNNVPIDQPLNVGRGTQPKRLWFRGECLTVREIAERADVPTQNVYRNNDGDRYFEAHERGDPYEQKPQHWCIMLTHQGVTATASEWARRVGLTTSALHNRLIAGWSVERALTEGLRSRRTAKITFRGVSDSLAGWARRAGIKEGTLYDRVNTMHWPIARALTEPPATKAQRRRQAKVILAMLDAFNAKHPPRPPQPTPKQTGGQSPTFQDTSPTGTRSTTDDLHGQPGVRP